ncbi:Rgg family transcriptional regulator [Carnobacterium maltaromaticum]|uniref:helix-turn-helix domain-containing protein n=1 Tax=Carnobacterium maltaromaticum TaxID=2751 RepID=UPI000C7755AE|nr:Rgg/GadR/MutR family transcriptional regulator [Carnobacterium maltaromaticum]PLS33739.1 Rgg family transcriptional regulator [Carnobacterium maltaromaticum]PLS35721.1 Rgg family transcriptional regulator [Carnobacterium maltaromaticum]PLS36170.1 Rgg family transcriptional regulator [Carnobacterium maltaromaticum]PLS42627.1 Rgg family transcriptional regulator [Carnobacterium maltaromaticum]PLS42862.1 Rgg family transcriptional regulator [Carnobacterium maltaromaticum]
MNNYGKVLRDIRISKGLSQKEIYSGIISKSYASAFEKGNHDIALILFEKILIRVNVSLDEFFFIYREFSLTDVESFWFNYEKSGHANNLKSLYLLYDELVKSNGPLENVQTALIHTRIHLIENLIKNQTFDISVVSEKDILTLKNYLFSVQTWTLEEIKIFANTIYFFEESLQRNFLEYSLTLIDTYKEYDRGRHILCGLLVNATEIFIEKNDLDYASKLILTLDKLCVSYTGTFHRIFSKYLKGLIKIKNNEIECGYNQSLHAISILKDLNYDDLAFLYDILLKQFIKNEHIFDNDYE